MAARFDGARGASRVIVDGERGGAWVVRGAIKVAFVFQVDVRLVHEIELIADPEMLVMLDVRRIG